MLLLYQPGKGSSSPVCLFTFHYASTLSRIAKPKFTDNIYLHSIMLLLYRISSGYYRKCRYSFTFHYASTLSSGSGFNRCRFIPIYIPLCFYFIAQTPVSGIRWSLYLHSIMLLLYPALVASIPTPASHLHSIMLLLYPDPIENYLLLTPFTFHYASTLSGEDVMISRSVHYLHSIMLLLYRCNRNHGCSKWCYLHSIMLLLYRRKRLTKSGWLMIYIPLCFYFIHGGWIKRVPKN